MKILLAGNNYSFTIPTERLFRADLIRTPNLDIYPFGWGFCDEELKEGVILSDKIESVGGVDVILYSVFWKNNWLDCFNKAKALKVSIGPDFYENAYRISTYKKHYKSMKFDIVFGYSTIVMDYLKKMDVGKYRYYLPFGVDIDFFKKCDIKKSFDVLAIYTVKTKLPNVYPYRARIHEILDEMPIVSYTNYVKFDSLPGITCMSKIVVNCNARFNFVNPRVTEILACGSFLLTSYCDDLAKFGYRDEEHLVTFHNMNDFKDKVEYFLKHDKEREEIAESGMNFVRKNYSNKKRIETFLKYVRRHL